MRIRRHSAAIDTTSAGDSTAGGTRPPPTVPCLLNQSPWDVATLSPDSTLQGFLVLPSPREADGEEAAHLKAAVKSMLSMAGGVNKTQKQIKPKKRRPNHPTTMSSPSAAELAPATLLMLSAGRQGSNETLQLNGTSASASVKANDTDKKDAVRSNGVEPHHHRFHPIMKRFGSASPEAALPVASMQGGKRVLWGKERRYVTAVKEVVAALPAKHDKVYRPRLRPGLAVTAKKPRRKPAAKASGGDYYYYSGFGPRWRSSKRRGRETETEPEPEQHEEAASASPKVPALVETKPADVKEAPAPAEEASESAAGEYAGGGGERLKKARKPMKKRSIKSFI